MPPRGCTPLGAFAHNDTSLRKRPITPSMSIQHTQRPRWEIDRTLDGLIGRDVRVAAKAVSPPSRNGDTARLFIPVGKLFLPDNSLAGGLPVFFEGRLVRFERKIGVVVVYLDAPSLADVSSEGTALFRGKLAVILHGPAVVELASPFRVEPLPGDPDNYSRDLRAPQAQFEFPFAYGRSRKTQTVPDDAGSPATLFA